MKRLGQKGFTAFALILIVVVIGLLVGGTVYFSYHQNQGPSTNTHKPDLTTEKTPDTTTKTTDPTANWKKIDSIGGAYSIKIPDGWELTNYPGNVLNGDSISLSEGKPAVITTATAAYAGDQKKFNVALTDKQYDAPQWQSPSQFGKEATADFAIGSLKGKRYSIEYTQTVMGVASGDKVYQYVFNLPTGKQLNIVYMQSAGDADSLKTVEQVIQTIGVN